MEYSESELKAFADVLKTHPQMWIATDDMYEHIRWNNQPFHNILNVCPELTPRTVVINGASKTYAMTGWRMGYAAGPTSMIAAMEKIQSQVTSNPCSISQIAATAALRSDHRYTQKMVKAYKERHDFVVEQFNRLPGIKCLPNHGTFYAFPNVSEAMIKHGVATDTDFATYLLDQAKVAVVPGTAFGAPDYVRLSYATSMEILKEAVERLRKAL
jgi:aspartate aminotransferase